MVKREYKGYAGKQLRCDLTTGKTSYSIHDPNDLKSFIGGRGLNSALLAREVSRDSDPLSPENPIILSVGPLTGTLLTASAYTTITARSPMTGILGDSAAGGHFGMELKQTGYDQLVIKGKRDTPCYLLITDECVEIRDASAFWGMDIWSAVSAIRHELKDNSVQIAAIGPAGENLVKYATVACNNSRMFGRTGMGCVFGSKNLKAIAVKGRIPIAVADPGKYESLCREIDSKILVHPEYNKRNLLGTTMLVSALNSIGILPTNHFQQGTCGYVDEISGERLAELYKTKNKSCFNCNVHCSRYYRSPDASGEGPEYETLCSYTSRIGSDDLNFALAMNDYLNKMGIDSVSSGETIGWAMECQQRGLLDKGDFDGLDFSWGNKDTVKKVLDMITFRRGIGDAFAEGTRSLSRSFGSDTAEYAMQVKGLDIICGDPRGIKAYGLTYAIASRGGDHLRAEPFFELTERYDEAEKRFGTRDAANRLAENGKAALVTYSERISLLTDCLTMCKNIGLCMDIIDFKTGAALLTAGTGMTFDPEGLEESLADMINEDRELNLSFGMSSEEDTLPSRFIYEPLTEGPSAGSTVNIDRMVKEYYQLHGWESSSRG